MNAESWADLELLDHILRGGSLSAAARSLGVDQTTVARRLAALERRCGIALLERSGHRLAPAPALEGVLGRLRAMSEEAAMAMAALRRAQSELRGHVRLTSVGFVLARILAPALGRLAAAHPGITLEMVADDQPLSFARREADIALRLGDRAEAEARIRRLGTLPFGLYRPVGAPGDGPVVRYTEGLAHLPEMLALDAACPGARVALACDRLDVLAEAALASGAGVMLPEMMAAKDLRFRAMGVRGERPLYLLLHPDRARVPSVARVAEWVEAAYAAAT